MRRIRAPRPGGPFARVMLGVALVSGALASCTPSQPRPPAVPTGVTAVRFAALWPEQDLPAAAAAQDAVTGGDETLVWRTDPTRTARRFASTVLGWPGSLAIRTETWTLDRQNLRIARIWLCEPRGCPEGGAAFDQEVVLKQLVDAGPGGVWSVTDVTSGRILLDEAPFLRIKDPKVRAGRRMQAVTADAADGGFPDGARVVAGSAYRGACGTVVERSAPVFRFHRIRFQVAARPDTTCGIEDTNDVAHGYVFVLPRDRTTPAAPASLFGAPRPSDVPPLHDLTAIAVRFVPRARIPDAPPDWLSRDPTTLPPCRPDRLRLGPISAGAAVSGFGVGVFVDLGVRGDGACHAVLDAEIGLRDARGRPIELAGTRVLHVDGYLPGYEPDRSAIPLGWGLFDWCGRRLRGPVRIRVTAAGHVATAASEALARFCPSRGVRPTIEHVPVGSSEIASAVTAAEAEPRSRHARATARRSSCTIASPMPPRSCHREPGSSSSLATSSAR